MRRLLTAFVLAAAALFPAKAIHAESAVVVDCPKLGYRYTLPPGWGLAAKCARLMAAAGNGLLLIVGVERHGWWNDDRSRASIQGDIEAMALVHGHITFNRATVGGHPGIFGITTLIKPDKVQYVFSQQETFAHGQMYKFRITCPMTTYNSSDKAAMLMSLIYVGIQIHPPH